MHNNKETVERYMEGFRQKDHAMILSCLAQDVIWDMPGYFYHEGIAAFDQEIGNEAFTGKPIIVITRMIEENDVVAVEGTVMFNMSTGELMNAVFCEVFEMEDGKVKKLTTYQVMK
ncbi:ketosteroid isomerase-like protein [Chitinophaga skermanii]|uniref:Ketosteroid isomerase-like protein n=1 Tax=Chitinophaga skermanii TaxID=331697 RepID=A0A327QPB0_9BACT|nr:nuclear transport factor 2 family protein [Chitinophaga skermanii]RAJ05183.1 ketosteroid isomerase-like protein [Chitinophaga skermanii]